MIIKYLITAIILYVLFVLAGCAPAMTDRVTLVKNMGSVLKLEKKTHALQAQVRVLKKFRELSNANVALIEQHYDVYYPYYLAANIYLVHGQIDEYKEAVKFAETELTAIQILVDEIMKNVLSY